MDNKQIKGNEVNNTPSGNNEPQVPVAKTPVEDTSNIESNLTENTNNEPIVTPTSNPVDSANVTTPVEEQPGNNEIRIVNGEIELNIEEPKKEEEKVEEAQVVEKKESKRLLPFMRNDDLLLLVMAIILVLGALNLDTIYDFISKNKFKLDPTPVTPSNKEENKEEVPSTKEYKLICSKKNDIDNYVFDYVYTINYKGTAYKMVYEIKSIDLSKIEDQEEYQNKMAVLNDFANSSFAYTENAAHIKGSTITVNADGTFKQELDLKVANKDDINKIEEVMYYNVEDSIERIEVQFENHNFECEMGD